jgi:hypothetical protein
MVADGPLVAQSSWLIPLLPAVPCRSILAARRPAAQRLEVDADVINAIRSLIAAIAAAISVSAGTVPVAAPAAQPPAILKLNSVACASPAYCVAVGQDVTDQRGFAEEWDGGAWRVIPVPDPGAPEALWDVACYAAGRCLTVGTYFNAAGVGVTLAALWDGSRWRLLSPASPGLADLLDGIACPSSARCVAVGATLASAYQPLAEQWNGLRWRELPSPAPGRSGALTAVACPSAARCVAVGGLDAADGTSRTFAALWNGRRWRVLATPPVARSNLVDVSCDSAARCVATGYSYPASAPASGVSQNGEVPGLRVLTEEWNGTAWRLLPFDSPAASAIADLHLGIGIDVGGGATDKAAAAATAGAGADGQLPGVACGLAAASCLAVGDYIDGAGRGQTLAGSWDGGSGSGGWRVLQPAYPAGAEAVLTDVACPSPAQCVAVGDYDYTTGELPFADVWNGRQWRLLTMPDE